MIKVAPATTLSEMDQLRQRYEELSKKKTICETNLANATRELDSLKVQAREQYGTDDLEALENRLEEMKAENLRLQEAYRNSLDAIEKSLEQIDNAYKAEI